MGRHQVCGLKFSLELGPEEGPSIDFFECVSVRWRGGGVVIVACCGCENIIGVSPARSAFFEGNFLAGRPRSTPCSRHRVACRW